MSILHPYPRDEIKKHFTHYGLFCGIVPVYVGPAYTNGVEDSDGCTMDVRNWVPEWLMDFVGGAYGLVCLIGTMLNPDLEPQWPIFITGEIE